MSAYSDLIVADDPSVYWRLGETISTTPSIYAGVVIDHSGNSRHGDALVGGAAFTSPWTSALTGDSNGSLRIANVGGAANVFVYHPTYGTTAFTGNRSFEGWFYRNEDNATLAVLFGGGGAAAPICYMGGAFGIPLTTLTFRPSNTGAIFQWTNVSLIGSWAHIGIRYEDSIDTAEAFVNGVFKGAVVSVGTWGATDSIMRVGFGNDGAATIFPWNGGIDEFAVYERLLTDSEFKSHYELGAGGPVANRRFVHEAGRAV